MFFFNLKCWRTPPGPITWFATTSKFQMLWQRRRVSGLQIDTFKAGSLDSRCCLKWHHLSECIILLMAEIHTTTLGCNIKPFKTLQIDGIKVPVSSTGCCRISGNHQQGCVWKLAGMGDLNRKMCGDWWHVIIVVPSGQTNIAMGKNHQSSANQVDIHIHLNTTLDHTHSIVLKSSWVPIEFLPYLFLLFFNGPLEHGYLETHVSIHEKVCSPARPASGQNLTCRARVFHWQKDGVEVKKLSCSWGKRCSCTPPKFNIAPENGWLEDYFSLLDGTFSGAMLNFRWVMKAMRFFFSKLEIGASKMTTMLSRSFSKGRILVLCIFCDAEWVQKISHYKFI